MMARIIAALSLACAVLSAVWRPHAPSALPASAPAAEFSAERAMGHLRHIASQPHPAGSDEHARVRAYLRTELARLGLAVEVQRATSVAEFPSPMSARYRVAARVQNIVARLPGQHSTGAVLLIAHYDSVAASTGGNDDGAAVAALLETVRALRAGPPLSNDVVVLLSDAEEAGLLGSVAFFAARDPLGPGAPIAAALNFEARGHTGPVLMFETAPDSGWLVREMAAACPHARASSLFDAVARFVPNATDFALARARGVPGLNFAYIEGIDHYHSSLDSRANVDPDSVQHHGEYALNLTRRLGARDLSRPDASSAVYFNLGDRLIVYSAAASRPLAAVAVIGWIAVVAYGLRTGRLRKREIARSAGAKLCEVIAVVAVTAGVTWLAARTHDEFDRLGDTYDHGGYVAGIVALAAALAAGSAVWQRRRRSAVDIAAGAALPWAVVTAAAAVWLPGAAFLFTWPLLGAALGLAALVRRRAFAPAVQAAALAIQALPVVALVIPMIPLVIEGLTLVLAAVAAAVLALALGLVAPHLAIAPGRRGLAWPAVLGALGAACVVHASWPRAPDAERPRRDSVLYAQDTDARRAVWASSDAALDDWTRPLVGSARAPAPLPGFMPVWDRAFWWAPAPVVPLSPPAVEVVSDASAGAARTLRIRVASTRAARSIVVATAAHVVDYRVDGVSPAAPLGEPGPDAEAPWDLWLEAGGAAPWDLELTLAAGSPVVLRVLDRSDGLPEAIAPRPEAHVPAASLDIEVWSNASFASRAVSLGPTPGVSTARPFDTSLPAPP